MSRTEHRWRIVIDHTRIADGEHSDFPLFVRLCDPDLRARAAADFFFSAADGQTHLGTEVVAYDGERGELAAWVRVPRLGRRRDTVLYLNCGTGDGELLSPWDDSFLLVRHGDEERTAEGIDPGEEITVEAWAYSDTRRPEVMQPLVSQWRPSRDFGPFAAYDASCTDGLDCTGYYGAVFDGRYIYCCPIRSHKRRDTVHAHVLRCDTHGDFRDPASWEAFDAAGTEGLNTVCYYGAAFDGRYVIFTPRDDASGYHSRVLRYDTHGNFKSASSWQAHEVDLPHSHQGVASDGHYLYFCPGYEGVPNEPLDESLLSGKVMRLDLRADFRAASTYRVFDTATLHPDALCFDGGAFDGRYIYFVPLTQGVVVRYDTCGDFASRDSWACYDARPLGMKMNVGAVFDGRHLYFCAYGHSLMVRYDTQGDFGDERSWQAYEAAGTGGVASSGFDGGFFDGRHVYFSPWTRAVAAGESPYHCNFLRYDTCGPFDDPQSWEAKNASATDGLVAVGYNAGAFDGRYFYAAPLYDGDGDKFHGRVLRCDTLGEDGTFSLRYCDYGHNGGLCAAVPGPSFIINTEQGVRSVAAHQVLAPGWHHLAGVYDGHTLKLFVDGALVAERAATGRLQKNSVAVTLGALSAADVCFEGRIEGVRIARVARRDGWIKTAYRNLADPAGFVRLEGAEEYK